MAKCKAKYWAGKGKYQKTYETYYNLLVPDTGDCSTEVGQILRFAAKIYYDIYNNGGINLKSPFFKESANFLKLKSRKLNVIAKQIGVEKFISKLSNFCRGSKNDEENDQVIDVIIAYIDRIYSAAVKFLRSPQATEMLLTSYNENLLRTWRTFSEERLSGVSLSLCLSKVKTPA